MKKIPLLIIYIYKKVVSPFLGPNCRYYPSCSDYSRECFEKLSIFKALWYSCKRILSCHPFSKGGIDYPKIG